MASLREKVDSEFANIEKALASLPPTGQLPDLSVLELAGVAALLHSFYNGIENVLKQVLVSQGHELPQGDSWHRDLVNLAAEKSIVSRTTKEELFDYLAFRHYFSHAYALDLYPHRLQPLVESATQLYNTLRSETQTRLGPEGSSLRDGS
ncbi:MAG: hypothetical protein QGH15_12970 [Kiritimatiellia bacterium]|jgi:hypothetical protein|nr:hypothetical protein [Kiritimatiellia bacterium]